MRRYFGGPAANIFSLIAVLIVLVAAFSLLTENFFSVKTFMSIANNIPTALFLATGMTFVLIIGGIDLSVGSVTALCAGVLGIVMGPKYGMSLPVGVVAALLTGLLCGLINGSVTVAWSIPSFIATLGMLEIARGACYLVTNSQTQYIGSRITDVADIRIQGLSLLILLALACVVAAQVLLTYTRFGRYCLAIGAKEEAARLSGIGIGNVKIVVFMLSGVLAGFAAITDCARLSAASPSIGVGYELQAIAAAVIGGTSLMGGRGSVVGSFLGVIILAVLDNGLASVGAGEHTKRIVTGLVIIVAVIIDYYRTRLRTRAN